jgi:protein-histidine pros-kinase
MERPVYIENIQEKIMHENEALLHNLFEYAPDAIIVVNHHGCITRINTQAETMFGYTREELLDQPLEILLPERFRERHMAHRLNYRTDSRIRPMGAGLELFGRRKNGSEFAVDIMLSPLMTADGGLVIAVVRDITERKRAEQERSQLASIVEFSDDAIIGKTPDGRIISWNQGAERIYGYTADEVKGQSIGLLVPSELPNDLSRMLASIQQGEVIQHYETLQQRKDGRRIHVSLTVSPIKDAAGHTIGISTIARDITERVRSEEKFRGLLESAPDAMVIITEKGEISLINSQTEKLFGYTREELLGQSVEILIPDRFRAEQDEHWMSYFVDLRSQPKGISLELYGVRQDGSKFPIEISLSPLQTDEEILVISAIRDVTERKLFEQTLREKNVELQHANQAKDRFLASMSHELRTPLNAIMGFTGTLLMKLPGPLTVDKEKQLRTIQTSARHLLSLINDLLDLTKIESGKVELHMEPVVCQGIVQDIVTTLRPQAENKGLTFDVVMPDQEITILTDRRSLSQILLNLTNNAIKFTEQGGIRLEVVRWQHKERTRVAFSLVDSGIGIRLEDQVKLFQAFAQVDSSATRRYEGTGLGLHLSQKLAGLLGGYIDFESQYGEGSRFTLVIPEK